jgi:hypothetical protein
MPEVASFDAPFTAPLKSKPGATVDILFANDSDTAQEMTLRIGDQTVRRVNVAD